MLKDVDRCLKETGLEVAVLTIINGTEKPFPYLVKGCTCPE